MDEMSGKINEIKRNKSMRREDEKSLLGCSKEG